MLINKPFQVERLVYLGQKAYLQFAHVHVEPQLQLTQVQFGVLHFTLFAVSMVLFVVVTDFMINFLNCF